MSQLTTRRLSARTLSRTGIRRDHRGQGSATTRRRDNREGRRFATTAYEPESYAFRFSNNFVNEVWSGRIPPRIGRRFEWSTDGRCGGMAFASLDFFHLRTPVPTLTADDFTDSTVPPDGHPLADYILTRQLHSMMRGLNGVRDGLRFARWSRRSTDSLVESTNDEIRELVESIDKGEPVVLGLIKATSAKFENLGDNHQVVCYGYRTDGSGELEFLIYEPNEPYDPAAPDGYEVVLRRREGSEGATFPYRSIRPGRTEDWRGFFVQRYRPRKPDARLIGPGGTRGGSSGRGGPRRGPGLPDPDRGPGGPQIPDRGGAPGGGTGLPDPERPPPDHLR